MSNAQSQQNQASDTQPAYQYAQVAVPVPLRQVFDFIIPSASQANAVNLKGCRVLVPFGPRKLVGVVVEVKTQTSVPNNRLKSIIDVLDQQPLFEPTLWSTLSWVSSYYCAPLGEVFELALPTALRKANSSEPSSTKYWQLSTAGRIRPIDELERAPVQLAIIKKLLKHGSLTADDFTEVSSSWRSAINALVEKEWVDELQQVPLPNTVSAQATKKIELNAEQKDAADQLNIRVSNAAFSCTLLLGVTGSGKTEVYFSAIDTTLQNGKQVLMLVPEIGLTPQLLQRFSERFNQPITVMHSGLSEKERHLAWWHASTGQARIIIGTRSAALSVVPELGLIVVDEEHDGSFKQQDGVRYHARDTAIYRAKQADIPIVLGSATPSLETYQNALLDRYHLIELGQRATNASLPTIKLIDLNNQPTVEGLTPTLLSTLKNTYTQGEQSMVFINRRGFAPAMYCNSCKNAVRCHRCDACLTVHKTHNRLRCHHCGYECQIPTQCSQCEATGLAELGEGTQRVESYIETNLKTAKVLRIDRDSTRNKGQLEAHLQQAKSGEAHVLVGTQLLTKGHDFDNLALVGVLEADHGLYSADFRASEHLFQQLVQVAGRAGRRQVTGNVLIQTRFKDHPLFEFVAKQDYQTFAQTELAQRQAMALPPFTYLALFRAESTHEAEAMRFLRNIKQALPTNDAVQVMDAVPAPMIKRAGRYRAQLLVQAQNRRELHQCLQTMLQQYEDNPTLRKQGTKVRWSLDIDPVDLY